MPRINTLDAVMYRRVLDAVASQASANTDWIQVFADANRATFSLRFGAVGTSLAMKLTQATSSGGANAKDITNAAITTVLNAAEGTAMLVTIEIGPGALDTANGFIWVRAEVVATGTCVWSVELELYDLRVLPPTQHASYAEAVRVYD